MFYYNKYTKQTKKSKPIAHTQHKSKLECHEQVDDLN
jgi:hypothetical protein